MTLGDYLKRDYFKQVRTNLQEKNNSSVFLLLLSVKNKHKWIERRKKYHIQCHDLILLSR